MGEHRWFPVKATFDNVNKLDMNSHSPGTCLCCVIFTLIGCKEMVEYKQTWLKLLAEGHLKRKISLEETTMNKQLSPPTIPDSDTIFRCTQMTGKLPCVFLACCMIDNVLGSLVMTQVCINIGRVCKHSLSGPLGRRSWTPYGRLSSYRSFSLASPLTLTGACF